MSAQTVPGYVEPTEPSTMAATVEIAHIAKGIGLHIQRGNEIALARERNREHECRIAEYQQPTG